VEVRGETEMRKCPVDENCVGFDNIGEFEEAFKKLAAISDEELADNTSVEGNSGLTYGDVKIWLRCFGIKNCYFDNSFENGFIDTFYFDLRNAKYDGNAFFDADEVSIRNGFLRIWYD
jgi:hypothetical protein